MYRLEKFNKDFTEDWDKLIQESKNGLFFFERKFMDYHADRFTDYSLMIYNKNKLVAAFPATLNNDEIISHGGLTFGSLIMSFSLKTKEVLDIFEYILAYYRSLNFKRIIYKAIPYVFHKYPSEEDTYALFRYNAKLIRRDISSIIQMDAKIKFSETKRQLIRKCIQKGIEVKESLGFSEFWILLSDVLQKFDTQPAHSIDEITYLKSSFPNHIKLYQAWDNEELLAGIVIFDFGSVIHTQYMASSDEGRKLGALDYINSVLLEEYKDRKYYSFGISTEKQGTFLNEGLIQQKENMGARGIALDFYEISLL